MTRNSNTSRGNRARTTTTSGIRAQTESKKSTFNSAFQKADSILGRIMSRATCKFAMFSGQH
ncbi:MAG TPA: hypothetical protein VLC29_06545, partial [Rhizomicrobium sp.]|nr:hypothetical protein [Rhizomicrobium sp.]